jgi:hypothetical protein
MRKQAPLRKSELADEIARALASAEDDDDEQSGSFVASKSGVRCAHNCVGSDRSDYGENEDEDDERDSQEYLDDERGDDEDYD